MDHALAHGCDGCIECSEQGTFAFASQGFIEFNDSRFDGFVEAA